MLAHGSGQQYVQVFVRRRVSVIRKGTERNGLLTAASAQLPSLFSSTANEVTKKTGVSV